VLITCNHLCIVSYCNYVASCCIRRWWNKILITKKKTLTRVTISNFKFKDFWRYDAKLIQVILAISYRNICSGFSIDFRRFVYLLLTSSKGIKFRIVCLHSLGTESTSWWNVNCLKQHYALFVMMLLKKINIFWECQYAKITWISLASYLQKSLNLKLDIVCVCLIATLVTFQCVNICSFFT
jgi:hypothetical protein